MRGGDDMRNARLPPPLAALASPWLANAWIPAGILGHHDRRVPEENCRQYERPVRCEVSAIAEAAVRTPSGWV